MAIFAAAARSAQIGQTAQPLAVVGVRWTPATPRVLLGFELLCAWCRCIRFRR